MKLSPWSLVKEIATLAYLMLTLSAIPKMPRGASTATNGSAYQFEKRRRAQTNQLETEQSPQLRQRKPQQLSSVRRGEYSRGIRGVVANRRGPERLRKHLRGRLCSNIAFTKYGLPFNSSFLVLRLNCFHHEAKSRFEGGELAPTGSGEVGRGWTGSAPGCDLPTVTMASPEGDSRWNRRC